MNQETQAMKTLITAGILAISTSAAVAQPFDFQRQIGSTEYVYDADTAHLQFAPVAPSQAKSAHAEVMLSANVDGIAPNDFDGSIVASGPTRISLYEVMRGSPEGIAYRLYHDRYPADADWDRIAREHRAEQLEKALASKTAVEADRS
jgi:hypothetical protein